MSEFEKWEISGVFPPGDYEVYGDWIVHRPHHTQIRGGIVYHKHNTEKGARATLFMMDKQNRCRQCAAKAPAGVTFRSRTSKLEEKT